jgi:hypothetical protein
MAYNKNRMKWRILLAGLALGALLAASQPVRVYSEFAQIDAAGNVTAPQPPREILSPAIVRNGFTSFQIVIQVPEKTRFLMHVGQNPDNAVKVTLYRRDGDELEPLTLPYESSGTQILWMDLWADKDAPVRRIKVEPQVNIDDDWVIYPMEVRVRDPQVPDVLPPATLQTLLCGGVSTAQGPQGNTRESSRRNTGPNGAGSGQGSAQGTRGAGVTVAQLRERNERQDAALATEVPPADRDELKKRLGGCNARPSPDPEAYLRARDLFFTPLWMRVKRNN